jgi:Rhs element Vgr protein
VTDERIIPLGASGDLATFTLQVDGQEINPEIQVGHILVRKEYNKISAATVVILDGDVAQQDFSVSNSDQFIPGNEIEIAAGYHSDESPIFSGVIVSQALKIRKNRPSQLIVECRDKAISMTATRNSQYFLDMSDSDIVQEIIGRYELQGEVETTEPAHTEMVQYRCSDWDFILTRAEANSKLVLNDDGTLKIASPDLEQSAVVDLNYGSTLMEFEAGLDARRQNPSSKAYAWNYSEQEVSELEASDPALSEAGNLTASDLSQALDFNDQTLRHGGKLSEQELQAWSDAKLYRNRLSKIIGRARCQGFAAIKPGSMVGFSGVGERYNGKHLITAVRHQLSSDNWETDLRFGMPDQWLAQKTDVMERPAAELLPGVRGLQIGLVVDLEDPDGDDRIQVTLPLIDAEGSGVWARVSTLDAGEQRGSFFRPEVGDEVLVGFIDDDPRSPVVLGGLNSSARPAPLSASNDNPEKGIVTRSGIKLLFNDDAVSFTLETPNGNKLQLSDEEGAIHVEDENGNSFKLSADGVALESAADISIKAAGDCNIEATNIQLKAAAEFKAEGSAGVEMSSSAIAKLKGSIVQIN